MWLECVVGLKVWSVAIGLERYGGMTVWMERLRSDIGGA